MSCIPCSQNKPTPPTPWERIRKALVETKRVGFGTFMGILLKHPAWLLCSTNTDSSVSADPSSVKLESKEELCFVSRQAEVQHGVPVEEAFRAVMLKWTPKE